MSTMNGDSYSSRGMPPASSSKPTTRVEQGANGQGSADVGRYAPSRDHQVRLLLLPLPTGVICTDQDYHISLRARVVMNVGTVIVASEWSGPIEVTEIARKGADHDLQVTEAQDGRVGILR